VPSRVFFAFRESALRRAALRAEPGSPARYSLFGLDEFVRRGVRVDHNLEREGPPPLWARVVDRTVNRPLCAAGGYGGDFASIFASVRKANAADVVFSTVDTVGIPLLMLKKAGLVRVPIVYTAVGLPERLLQLRGRRMERLYRDALRRVHAIVSYAESEVDWLGGWLGPAAPPVVFVPFGVDVDAFRPEPDRQPDVDVVSIGTDPRRDFGLLITVATRHPELGFRIVTSRDHARMLGPLPANVTLETDIPLEQARDRLAGARIVALPVHDNSYSGATTVLLQAMAMAKPVVVSRTEAVTSGYALADGINCRLVEPGDTEGFERAVLEVLAGADAASSLGTRARETVERSLSWERYTDTLWQVLVGATR
jgi:glycosyltransferase involved in cell wall biosynthesis